MCMFVCIYIHIYIMYRIRRARGASADENRIGCASGTGAGIYLCILYPSPPLVCKTINRSHAHRTHRQRKHSRHRHTHAHDKTRNEHLPQALNNAQRWRDDGACHLPRPGGWPPLVCERAQESPLHNDYFYLWKQTGTPIWWGRGDIPYCAYACSGQGISLYKILFHFKALLWESIIYPSSLYCPPPPAKPTLLQSHCTAIAQHTLPHRPLLVCRTPYNSGDGNIL